MTEKLIDTNSSAIDLVAKHATHLWDATIAACMKENNITEIVTENKSDFERIPDIKVTVPF